MSAKFGRDVLQLLIGGFPVAQFKPALRGLNVYPVIQV